MAYTYMVEVDGLLDVSRLEELVERYISTNGPVTRQIITTPLFFIDQYLEELECIKLFLNKHNVPTERDGKPLSYVGRIEAYAEMKEEKCT